MSDLAPPAEATLDNLAEQAGMGSGVFHPIEITIWPPGRELLEKYSNIPSEQVVPHVQRLREKAWKTAPYGCVGFAGFTLPTIQLHPRYSSILHRLRDGHKLLDLGCGFAQNIRKLIFDGAPGSHLTGADLSSSLIECGFELFRDKNWIESKFLVGDIFVENSDIYAQAAGGYDIIWAAMFFHLWGWDQQLEASKKVVKLLKPHPGSTLVGWQMGNTPAVEAERTVDGRRRGHEKTFRHDEESFRRMWRIVGEQTGTEWKVEPVFDYPELMKEIRIGREALGRITFTVERV